MVDAPVATLLYTSARPDRRQDRRRYVALAIFVAGFGQRMALPH